MHCNYHFGRKRGCCYCILYVATVDYTPATESDGVTTPATYEFTAAAGLDSDTTTPTIALGEDDANVITDFAATVTTPENSDGVYTVNGDTFDAEDSALEIDTTGDGATLKNGTVALDVDSDSSTPDSVTATNDTDSAVTATGGDGITVTTSDGVVTEIGNIDNSDTFTVGTDYYEKTPAGILKTDSDGTVTAMIKDSSDATAFNPNDTDTVIAATTLEDVNNISLDGIDSDTAFLTPENDAVVATVEYTPATESDGTTTPATYELTANEGMDSDTTPTVALGNEDANVVTDFDATITTPDEGNGTYTVNGDTFTASDSALEIATTPSGATLTNGTVALDATDSDTVTATNDTDSAITATAGDGVSVEVSDGTVTAIGSLNDGDTFTIGSDTYEVTAAGLFKTDKDGNEYLVTDNDSDDTKFTVANESLSRILSVDSEGTLDLANINNIDTAAVYSYDKSKKLADLSYDSDTGFSFTDETDPENITKIKLREVGATVTVDFDTTIETEQGTDTYIVNGISYVASDTALTITATSDTSTLSNGTVIIDSYSETAIPESVVVGNDTIKANGTTIGVTAENDSAITVSNVDTDEQFTINDTVYVKESVGLFKDDYNAMLEDSSGDDYTFTIDDENWTKSVIIDSEITLDAATVADSDIVFVNADKTATVARYDSDTNALTAESSDAATTPVVVNDVTVDLNSVFDDVTLNDGATVTTEDNQEVTVASGATATINNTTVDNTANESDATVTATDESGSLNFADGSSLTVTSRDDSSDELPIVAIDSDGNVSEVTIGNIDEGELYTGDDSDGGTYTFTDEDGKQTFNITDDNDDTGATFTIKDGKVVEVSDLDPSGTITVDGSDITIGETGKITYNSDTGLWEEGANDNATDTSGNYYILKIDSNGQITLLASEDGENYSDTAKAVDYNAVINGYAPVADGGKVKTFDSSNPLELVYNTDLTVTIVNEYVDDLNVVLSDDTDTVIISSLNKDTDKYLQFNTEGATLVTFDSTTNTVSVVDSVEISDDSMAGVTINLITAGQSLTLGDKYTVALESDTAAVVIGDTLANVTVNDVALAGESDVKVTSSGDTLTLEGVLTVENELKLNSGTIEVATETKDITLNDSANVTGIDGTETALEVDSDATVTINGFEIKANDTAKVTAVNADSIKFNPSEADIIYNDITFSGDGEITLTLENGELLINGNALNIVGDSEYTVVADGDSISAITGVGAAEVSVISAAGAGKIETDSEGKFTFGSDSDAHVFEISDDTNIAFELTDDAVTGIVSLESGTVAISQDETLAVNDENITLSGVEDAVTLTVDDSAINSVAGLNGLVNGLTSTATVNVIDSDVTINSAVIQIADTDNAFDAMVDNGAVATITGINANATVTTAQELAIVTEDEGVFTFNSGDENADIYTISGDDSVTFTTNSDSRVTSIADFEGSLTTNDDDKFSINGAAIEIDKADGNEEIPTIVADSNGISEIAGLESGDSISGDLDNATITIPSDGTLTINDGAFALKGDEDGVVMVGDSITGLDANASLTVGAAATYTVSNASDTETVKASVGDVIVADKDGEISLYDPSDFNINGDSTTDEIIRALTGLSSTDDIDKNYTNDSSTALTSFDTEAGAEDGNLIYLLDNDTDPADFSDDSGIKKVTLEGGDQELTFNDEGGNIAVVDDDADGEKVINLGNGGDIVVVETFTIDDVSYEFQALGLFRNIVENDDGTKTAQLLSESIDVGDAGEQYIFDLTGTWVDVVVLNDDSSITLTADTADTTYVDSAMTKIIATYTEGTGALAVTSAEDLSSVAIDNDSDNSKAVTFTGVSSDTTISSGGASFAVADSGDDGFTVDGNTVSGANDVSLTGGTVSVDDGATVSVGDTKVTVSDGDGYTVTATTNSDTGEVSTAVENVSGSEPSVSVSGGSATVAVTPDSDTGSTYTDANGTKVSTGSNSNGSAVTLTYDSDGNITGVNDIEEDNIVEVDNSSGTSDANISVNGSTDSDTNSTAAGEVSYLKAEDKESGGASKVEPAYFYAVIGSDKSLTVYDLDTDTFTPSTNLTESLGVNYVTSVFGSFDSETNTIKLARALAPTDKTYIFINNEDNEYISLTNIKGSTDYFSGLNDSKVLVYGNDAKITKYSGGDDTDTALIFEVTKIFYLLDLTIWEDNGIFYAEDRDGTITVFNGE